MYGSLFKDQSNAILLNVVFTRLNGVKSQMTTVFKVTTVRT